MISPRTRNVWGALLATLTVLGGTLYSLDSKAAPRADGVSLPALLAPTSSAGVEVVFNTKTPVQKNRWQSIIIHHSASPYATPESLDQDARASGLVGLGDHFVIGNGNGMPDGDIQPTFRWNEQIEGAHTGGTGVDKIYNQAGIGIVLIGNFEEAPPTQAQIRSARRLVRTLKSAYHVSDANIIGHRDAKATECPGKLFPMSTIKQ